MSDKVGRMYDPNKKDIDKDLLAQTLQSISVKFDTIHEDALLLLLQKIADGEPIEVSVDYPKMIDKLYKERTIKLIEELKGCISNVD